MCFRFSRYLLCMAFHYWFKARSRADPINCPVSSYFSTVHTRIYIYTNKIHNSYFYRFHSSRHISSNKTKNYSPNYEISWFSSTSRHVTALTYFPILILCFKICDKEICNLFESVLLVKQFLVQIKLNFLCLNTF